MGCVPRQAGLGQVIRYWWEVINQVVVRDVAVVAEKGGDVWRLALKFSEEEEVMWLWL